MFAPLTDYMIQSFNSKYLFDIKRLEQDVQENKFKSIDTFWNRFYIKPISFNEYVYLQMKSFQFNLPTQMSDAIYDDHVESIPTLIELSGEGILTTSGQRSYYNSNWRQRSYLEFEFGFNTNDIDSIVEMLNTLHNKGLNVFATMYKLDPFRYDQDDFVEDGISFKYGDNCMETFRSIGMMKSDNTSMYDLNVVDTYNFSKSYDSELYAVHFH